MSIAIRQAQEPDAAEISRLIGSLYHYFLADPASEAAQPFLATVTPDAVMERIASANFCCYVAEGTPGLYGFVALRDRTHLYHLFVAQTVHRQGVARALWQHVLVHSGSSNFTVNSSFHAVPVYERFGFVATDTPQTKDGLMFVLMAYGVTANNSFKPNPLRGSA